MKTLQTQTTSAKLHPGVLRLVYVKLRETNFQTHRRSQNSKSSWNSRKNQLLARDKLVTKGRYYREVNGVEN